LVFSTWIFGDVISQDIQNPDMGGDPNLWDCDISSGVGVEINNEVTYGGIDPNNWVAEVDVTVGLCQIVTGFIPGEQYELSFDCSGRSSACGPDNQSINVTIDGVLSENIFRDNTFFDLVNERFCFTASSTTHTLNFVSTTVPEVSCGAVIDNVEIVSHVFDLGSDLVLCEGEIYDLDVSTYGTDFEWQNGSTNASITISNPGTYGVEITSSVCMMFDDIDVSYVSLDIDLGNDITLCGGTNLTLNAANPGASYVWQDGSSNSTFVVTEAGTYSVEATIGSCAQTDEIIVNYADLAIDLGEDVVLCSGEDITLDAFQSGASYLWQDGSTEATLNVNSPGTYSVELTIDGCSATDQVVVTENNYQVDLGPDLTICSNGSITIDATSPNGTYQWLQGETSPTLMVNEAGIYEVEVNSNGCISSDQIEITIEDISVDLGNDVGLCEGQTMVLDATTANATYLWQDGSTDATLVVSQAGTYSVEVFEGSCSAMDTIMVSFDALNVNLGNDVAICAGESVVLMVDMPNADILWQNNSSEQTQEVTQSGNYSVEVSIGNCTASDDINITVNPIPNIGLGNDTTICSGNTLALNATWPNATYIWQDGSANASFEVTETGSYSVEVTADGCSKTDEIQVTINDGEISLGPDLSLCEGETVTLNPGITNGNFTWQNGSTESIFTVNESGTYWVEIISNGCTMYDEVEVVFGTLEIDLGEDVSICSGESILLDPGITNGSFLWQDNSTAPTLVVSESGTYSVEVTTGNCSASDEINVSLIPNPTVDLGPDLTFCSDTTVILDASAANGNYEWQDGSTASTFTTSNSGTYSVTVTNGECTSSDELVIDIGTFEIDLGDDISLCEGTNYVIDATVGGATYIWQDGSTESTFVVSDPGNYSVSVFLDGCSAEDDINVTIGSFEVDLGDDIFLCQGESAILDASTTNATYLWQDNSTGSTLIVVDAGTYSVEVTVDDCMATDEVIVTSGELMVDLGQDATLCEGENMLLDAYTPGATYQWQNNSVDSVFNVTQAGEYSVVVTSGNCVAESSISISYTSPPEVNLGNNFNVCDGENFTLDATYSDAEYLWQDGTSTPTFVGSESGLYWVTVSLNNCTASDSVLVTSGLAEVDLGADTLLCIGSSLTLEIPIADAQIVWQDGSIGNYFQVESEGIYFATVTLEGCEVVDSIQVAYAPLPSAAISGGTIHCPDETVSLEVEIEGTPPFLLGFTRDNVPIGSIQTNDYNYILNTAQEGEYRVETITDFYCIAEPEGSTIISEYPPLNVVSNYDSEICAGETVNVNLNISVYINVQSMPVPMITTSHDSICAMAEVTFESNNDDPETNCIWTFDDDSPISDCGPIVQTYGQTGFHSATLYLETTAGCHDEITLDSLIFVIPNPNAAFIYTDEDGNVDAPGIQFENLSFDATNYEWDFGDGEISVETSPFHDFPLDMAAEYITCLTAINDLGCENIQCDIVEIQPVFQIHVPNSFTPNEDGVNDLFRPVTSEVLLAEYQLFVFDRGGLVIFESNDQNEFWNGSNKTHMDYYVPDGVYVYQIIYREEGSSETQELFGNITIIR